MVHPDDEKSDVMLSNRRVVAIVARIALLGASPAPSPFKLRADDKKKLGSAYTRARFHHDFLQYGDPAIPLLRPLLSGADDDGKILPDL